MAADISPMGVHKPEHSHQPVATHESLKSSRDESLIKAQTVVSTITDQGRTQRVMQRSHSSEATKPRIMMNDEVNPTQKSLGSQTETKDIIMVDEADAQDRMQRRPLTSSEDIQPMTEEEFIHANQDLMSKAPTEDKRTSKRSKKQKSRITDVTIQADLDGASIIDARAELQVSRKELKDPKNKLQEGTVQVEPSKRELRTRKNKLSYAQHDLQEDETQDKQKLANVRRKLKASQDNLRRMKNTCIELKRECKELAKSQDELTACKDELFRLQPIAQIPDSRVVKEFEDLCHQIINWIEAEVVMFEKAHPESGPEHIFSIGEDKEAARFMNQHPRSGEHVATHMIHCWLQDHIFGQRFSCLGLPAEATQLLKRAEQSMTCLDPPRDSTTIAAWRSETLKALTSTEECREFRTRTTQAMNGRLFKDLSKTLPILFSGPQRQYSFYAQILEPAVTLGCTMQESTAKYAWSMQKGLLVKWAPFSKGDLQNHKMVDIKTGKRLKPDSLVTADQQGSIGTVVLMVEPRLCRDNGDHQGHILRQKTFIVNLDFPLQKRNRP